MEEKALFGRCKPRLSPSSSVQKCSIRSDRMSRPRRSVQYPVRMKESLPLGRFLRNIPVQNCSSRAQDSQVCKRGSGQNRRRASTCSQPGFRSYWRLSMLSSQCSLFLNNNNCRPSRSHWCFRCTAHLCTHLIRNQCWGPRTCILVNSGCMANSCCNHMELHW